MIASRYQPLLRYLAELVAADIIAGNVLDSDSEPQHNVNHETKQRETSIEDQARVYRARAEALQFQVVAVHADDELSGSTPVASRPGGKALLADALAGRFQVMLLEGLDRLSRDQVEQETIIRRLEHRGIRILGCSDGYDSTASGRKLHRSMRGLINEIYLDDLRDRNQIPASGNASIDPAKRRPQYNAL